MRWPGKVLAGSVCKEIATIMDVLPTLAKLAGTNAPADRVIDGKDIWPLITGLDGAKTPHEAFFYHSAHGKLAAVRSGNWKLHIASQDLPSKKKGKNDPPFETQLYDLQADLGEKNNVAAEHPDVVKRLTGLMEKFDAEIKANSRPVGKI
jgi:arylsulfatase A-like enzyme